MKIKKMNKDQIQKIVLSIIGFIALIYCYFTFFLGPLDRSRVLMAQTIADTQAKTASSKSELKKTANLELQAKAATSHYEALKAMTEPGAPIAWFPPKMRNLFAAQGIEKANVKLDSSGSYKQPELSDWIRDTWAIELPLSGYDTLGNAIAKLENQEPLLAVQRIAIHTLPEEQQFQEVKLNVQIALLAQ